MNDLATICLFLMMIIMEALVKIHNVRDIPEYLHDCAKTYGHKTP